MQKFIKNMPISANGQITKKDVKNQIFSLTYWTNDYK